MSNSITHSSTCSVLEDGTGCDCRILDTTTSNICKESGCSTPIGNRSKYCDIHKRKCIHGKQRSRCKECGGSQICEHNRERCRCKECGGTYICKHNKRRSDCKECGGASICEHNRERRICKECGGASICEHNRVRSRCKECGGSQICEHNRERHRCKECGGASICEHNKRRSLCKECGGASICEHNRVRSLCKECGGTSICEHNRVRRICKECGGASICEHNRVRSLCKECGGTSICEHNRVRSLCKECGGSQICEHNKRRSTCKECGGSQICKHKKERKRCKECGGSQLCKTPLCETHATKKYEGYCLACFVNNPENRDKPIIHNYKTKEKTVVDNIKETFPDFTWVTDKRVQDGCSLRRPDLLLDMGTHIIIVEIDENKHSGYECSCENKRLMLLSQDLHHRSIVFIRFNPDGYTDQNGVAVKSCWKLNKLGVMSIMKTKEKEWNERIKCLKEQIQYWVDHPTEKTIEIVELFYDAD